MESIKGILIADIGASNARMAVTTDCQTLTKTVSYKLSSFDSIELLIQEYFKEISFLTEKAILGIAAPILGDQVNFTNCDIKFSQKSLKQMFFSKSLIVLNDLELQAHALKILKKNDIEPIGKVEVDIRGSKILVSPGTGLGIAGVVKENIIFTEGGHLNIPEIIPTFNPILHDFESKKGRLATFEDFLSGKGINFIYSYLSKEDTCAYTNEEILTNLDNSDCFKTKELMQQLLAVFLRYMALIWGSTSGVFIAGSIARTLLQGSDHKEFRKSFENSLTMKELLVHTPIFLVKDIDLGLKGGLKLASAVKKIIKS